MLAIAVPERASICCEAVEHEERDGVNALLPDGRAVGAPHLSLELIALEELFCSRSGESQLSDHIQQGAGMRGRAALLKVSFTQRIHIHLLFTESCSPKHEALRVDRLPIGLDIVVNLDTCCQPQLVHVLLGLRPGIGTASHIPQQRMVPSGLLPLWCACPSECATTASVVSPERVWVTGNIDLSSDIRMLGMKSIQSQLNILLADVPVRSLSARHEVSLNMKSLSAISARPGQKIERPPEVPHRRRDETAEKEERNCTQ